MILKIIATVNLYILYELILNNMEQDQFVFLFIYEFVRNGSMK